jgi:hypothetical protein
MYRLEAAPDDPVLPGNHLSGEFIEKVNIMKFIQRGYNGNAYHRRKNFALII